MGSTHLTKHRKTQRAAVQKRADSACNNGGFYKEPTSGKKIDSLETLSISWDTSCLSSAQADIYLYAPGTQSSRIHIWEGVTFSDGQYDAELKPRWWNATSLQKLQLSIVEAGTAPFLSPYPAGPVFTATYEEPDTGTPESADTSLASNDSGITTVNSDASEQTSKGLSKGATTAAVIVPLLFVAALIAAYFRISRKRGQEKRKRFSEAVDKRMSTISADWKSMSPAGAQAAIRNSMAVSGDSASNRLSSFSFGNIRPTSSIGSGVAESGHAGFDATPQMYQQENVPISHLRHTIVSSHDGERVSRVSYVDGQAPRVSRVSFADGPNLRPSIDARRSAYSMNGASRSFHTAMNAPPLPTRQDSDSSDNSIGMMSPTQTVGAFTLTSDDINELPALSMMRTGNQGAPASPEEESGELMFPPVMSMPVPQPYSLPVPPQSPVGMMPMQPVPESVMSPDDMMKAYAAARQVNSTTAATFNADGFAPITYPTSSAQPTRYNAAGMRVLYDEDENAGAPPVPGFAQ
ncbi:hypothetical protein BD626DRAFT_545906 [Schizophyllum amplum]|uniref:Uncharacterized protein n=1 Tax=Schizophyllum amplum TaxID=97359 RepID=A0A550CQ11_9AGAR|nr:hypothetical protein BD626DRAFT_545906 [Auriculariopsis ampla]